MKLVSDLVDLSKVPALFLHKEKEEFLTEIFFSSPSCPICACSFP